MNILIIGSGAREHAIGRKVMESPLCEKLFFAPGNGGTSQIGTNLNHLKSVNDPQEILQTVKKYNINLVIIGSEALLVTGTADVLRAENILTVGPGKAGAQLESSKVFSKSFMLRHGIPTAKYRHYFNFDQSLADLPSFTYPIVIKADGLAAGKGVIIAQNLDEAAEAVFQIAKEKKFGEAGNHWLAEEFLDGKEVSVFILTDGKDYVILPPAKDYKRIGEADTGPNTGGMGSVAPIPYADEVFMEKVKTRVIEPTLKGLKVEQIDYRGFIFLGLMSVAGEPKVLEYNARLGDPETQSVLQLIKTDFTELLKACAEGNLAGKSIEFYPQTAVTVVMASEGYPEKYETGFEIRALESVTDVSVFHAGTRKEDDKYITSGGRVLAFTAIGKDLKEAKAKAYKAAESICYENIYYRRDIGKDLEV